MFPTVGTKEAAFAYALASATVVHTVALKCAELNGSIAYCGCDKTVTWGCLPDITFSMNFTKQLLDRSVSNTTQQHKAFVLHNTEIGQTVSSYS